MSAKISKIYCREILDSSGFPTLETTVFLDDGSLGTSSAPNGISISQNEPKILQDDGCKRLAGKGVLKAVDVVTDHLGPKILNFPANDQQKIDLMLSDLYIKNLDLGINSLYSLSVAVAKAAANSQNIPLYAYLWEKYSLSDEKSELPHLIVTMFEGGLHGDKKADFEEFQIVPSTRFGFRKGLEIAVEIYHSLKTHLRSKEIDYSTGPGGGLVCKVSANTTVLQILDELIKKSDYMLNTDVFLSLQPSAEHFESGRKYILKDSVQEYSTARIIEYYDSLNRIFHLLLLIDPMGSDDWAGWENLSLELGKKVVLVADDLVCGQNERLAKAQKLKACSGLVIKPLQTPTVTQMALLAQKAKQFGWQVIVSKRGTETTDDFLADFAVGIGASYAKFGAPVLGENLAKYERLQFISEQLGK